MVLLVGKIAILKRISLMGQQNRQAKQGLCLLVLEKKVIVILVSVVVAAASADTPLKTWVSTN